MGTAGKAAWYGMVLRGVVPGSVELGFGRVRPPLLAPTKTHLSHTDEPDSNASHLEEGHRAGDELLGGESHHGDHGKAVWVCIGVYCGT